MMDYKNTDALIGEINSAIFKHGEDQTPLSKLIALEEKYIISVEEGLEAIELLIGQLLRVTRSMTYDGQHRFATREEMLQAAAMFWTVYVGMGEE